MGRPGPPRILTTKMSLCRGPAGPGPRGRPDPKHRGCHLVGVWLAWPSRSLRLPKSKMSVDRGTDGLDHPGPPRPPESKISLGRVWMAWAASGRPDAQNRRCPLVWVRLAFGPPRPRGPRPAGHRPGDIFDFGCLGGSGRPVPADQAVSSMLGIWAAPGGPVASRAPWPSDVFDFGGLGGPGRPGSQPDTGQATSSTCGSGRPRAAQAIRAPTKRHLRFWGFGRARAAQASRAPTKRHHRFWVSGRPRSAQAGRAPTQRHQQFCGAWAAPGPKSQPDPDQRAF